MYLTKKTYVGANYEHRKVTGKCDIKIEGKKLPIDFKRISYIIENVGYWRKANQIHKWFVDNVQKGKDDCGEYEVNYEQLSELLSLCKQVKEGSKLVDGAITNGYTFEGGVKVPIVEEGKEIANPEIAQKLLPAASGFFFGSTDYDEYYMADINETIDIIEPLLKEAKISRDGEKYLPQEIYYSSSW